MNSNIITLPLLSVNSAHCAMRVSRSISAIPAIEGVEVDHQKHEARFSTDMPAQAVREAVVAVRQAGYGVATEVLTFNTTGVTCAGCATSVGEILNKVPGIISATVDHMKGEAVVEVVKDMVKLDEMIAALRPAGYGLIRQAA